MLQCARSWAAAPPAALLVKGALRAPAAATATGRRWVAPRVPLGTIPRCFLSSTAGNAGSGSLYVAGFSPVGALGLGGDVKKVHTPTLIETAEKVKDVACGRKFTLFVTQVLEGFDIRS